MSTEGIIVIIVLIIVFVAIGVAIYYFFFQKKGNKTGESCTSNLNCASGHYCGGDGRCQLGPSGRTSGSECTDSSQCQFGLTCSNGKCESNAPPPPTNEIASFDNSQVTTMINDVKHYLVIGPRQTTSEFSESFWSTTKPNTTLAWSNSRNEATATGNVAGDVTINGLGNVAVGSASKIFFVKLSDGSIVMEDEFSNMIKYTPSDQEGVFGAEFIDLDQYPEQPANLTGETAFVTIEAD